MSKIVLRLLPPDLTEDGFLAFVGPDILTKSTWKAFYPSDRPDKNSTGYLYFDKSKDADSCVAELNGKVVTKSGYRAVVCLAPLQKIPAKVDPPVQGKIQDESLYMQFIASMNLKAPLPPAVAEPKGKDFKTPIVEYIEGLFKRTIPKNLEGKTKKGKRGFK